MMTKKGYKPCMLAIRDLVFFCTVVTSCLAGILLPGIGGLFEPFIIPQLMVLLFLSFLTIRFDAIGKTIRDHAKEVAWLSFLKLIALPLAIYFLFLICCPAYAPSALLLAGISTGVVAPFISTMVSANGPLVLVMVVVSSFLVPFTLPSLAKILLGRMMEIPLSVMVRMLAILIFIPAAAVEATRRLLPGAVGGILTARYPLSLLAFMGVNMGVFSKYSGFFFQHPGEILAAIVVSFVLGGIFLVLGLFALGRAPVEDRLASAIAMGNINNVLVVVFAARFFGPPEPTVAAMYLIPFYGLIIPLRMFQRRNDPLCTT